MKAITCLFLLAVCGCAAPPPKATVHKSACEIARDAGDKVTEKQAVDCMVQRIRAAGRAARK